MVRVRCWPRQAPPAMPQPPPPPVPPAALLKDIDAAAKAIDAAEPASSGPHWGAMHKLLLKAKADPQQVAHLVATRDRVGLARLLGMLHGEAPEDPKAADATANTGPARAAIDPETLESALRAFRKRLKLTRLDHESKLSVRPLTSGRTHDVDAIVAPREFPAAVWEALADAGRLRRAGQGFYALSDDHAPPR